MSCSCSTTTEGGSCVWLVGSDMRIVVDELKDSDTGEFVNGATITAQMADEDGEDVGDEITLAYEAGSEGKYAGVIPADLDLTRGGEYTLTITIETVGGRTHTKRITRLAQYDAG